MRFVAWHLLSCQKCEYLEEKLTNSRVDVAGSCAQDCTPRFPLPVDILPCLRPRCQASCDSKASGKVSSIWEVALSGQPGICDALEDLSELAALLENQPTSGRVWNDPMFVGLMINPVVPKLLSVPRYVNGDDITSVMHEACRIATLLYLDELRRQFGVYPVPTELRVAKLMTLLTLRAASWRPFQRLLLWVLVIGGINSLTSLSSSWFAHAIGAIYQELGLSSWKAASVSLAGLPWNEHVFAAKYASLRSHMIQYLPLIQD